MLNAAVAHKGCKEGEAIVRVLVEAGANKDAADKVQASNERGRGEGERERRGGEGRGEDGRRMW